MQPYMQGYQYQPQYPQPYQDRLAQLQNQYQQTMPQQQMQPMQQQVPQTNQGILWVQGEAGAKSYLVAPNTTVLLMDSDNNVFYLKSADNSGMPSLRTFAYTEMTSGKHQTIPMEERKDFVEREEFENFKNEIFEKIKPQPSAKSRKANANVQE